MSNAKLATDSGHRHGATTPRRGVACVEFAVVCPILLLLFLGIVEVGQFANIGHAVSNASREGARIAARQSTTNVSKVQTAVINYLTDTYPNLPTSAVQVSVSSTGNPVTGGGITAVPTGAPISVQVVVQYDPARWLNALPLLDGRALTRSTVTRRE
jgi:Flp pilus assembly protein TadG